MNESGSVKKTDYSFLSFSALFFHFLYFKLVSDSGYTKAQYKIKIKEDYCSRIEIFSWKNTGECYTS